MLIYDMKKPITDRIKSTLPLLDEKQRRLYLAHEAMAIGYGGVSQISKITGVSRVTITRGIKENNSLEKEPKTGCRIEGGGRKSTEKKSPQIMQELEKQFEMQAKDHPADPLIWTKKSIRIMETELKKKGYSISDTTIAKILRKQGYSLPDNRRYTSIKPNHPDFEAQFNNINKIALDYINADQPVVSINVIRNKDL